MGNKTYNENYFEKVLKIIKNIPDESIDLILCDFYNYNIPNRPKVHYKIIDTLWKEYERIIKAHGCIIISNTEPLTPNKCEEFIKKYTNKKDIVLSNFLELIDINTVCQNLDRNFIDIELKDRYFKNVKEEIEKYDVSKYK